MKQIQIMILLVTWFFPCAIKADEPVTYSIQYIRQHLSDLDGHRVRIEDVVCFVETQRLGSLVTYVQDSEGGAWSGTDIFDRDERLLALRGDTVTAVGIVSASEGCFDLVTSSETEYPPVVTGTGTIPDPIDLTCAEACLPMYLDCLIRLRNVQIASAPDSYGNIDLNDDTGLYRLLLWKTETPPEVGTIFEWMTGLNQFHFAECKIRPRDEADWGEMPLVTPTPTISLGVRIEMPHSVHPGDLFYVLGVLNNPTQPMNDVPVFFILNIASDYWFWPTWVSGETGVDFNFVNVPVGSTSVQVIDSIPWPETGSLAMENLIFFGAMLKSDYSSILGEFAEVSWQFGP